MHFVYFTSPPSAFCRSFVPVMKVFFKRLLKILTGRPARNVYFWLFLTLFTLKLNNANATVYHYDFSDPWYYKLHAITFLLLLIITYLNNLWLVPHYLARKRYAVYFPLIIIIVFSESVLHVLALKQANLHFDTSNMNQMGIMSLVVSKSWSVPAIVDDALQYMVGNVIWVFLFTMAWYMNDYTRQQKVIEAAQKKQVETELHFLKNQINPHFLFNTLNNLYGLSLKKSDKSPDAILRLSSILRYLLYESNVEFISFDKEKELMRAYIDLELLRLPEGQEFYFTIHANKEVSLPPLLWLPILENIFKHATRVIADKYFIDYRFIVENDLLTIYSKNNHKTVLNKEENGKAGGIGLTNLRKRLALLYPNRHTIEIRQDEDYYITEVKIILS